MRNNKEITKSQKYKFSKCGWENAPQQRGKNYGDILKKSVKNHYKTNKDKTLKP